MKEYILRMAGKAAKDLGCSRIEVLRMLKKAMKEAASKEKK